MASETDALCKRIESLDPRRSESLAADVRAAIERRDREIELLGIGADMARSTMARYGEEIVRLRERAKELEAALDEARGIVRQDGHVWRGEGTGDEYCDLCGAVNQAFGPVRGPCPNALAPPPKDKP